MNKTHAMDSPICSIDDRHFESHLPNSKALEVAYEEILRKSDLIIRDEGARRLRLRILLLENENDDLHEQLALGDDRIDVLEQEYNNLRGESTQAQEEASRLESELRSQARELSSLKAELNSMNGITIDSTRLLTEKLSLSRELAILKPEIDHLRSQALHQQTVLAEKLALQRQVSTLEVELEAEKRVTRRALENNARSQKESDLQTLVDKLERDLAREKREKEKAREEAEVELQNQVEELKMELAREKREKHKARKESDDEFQSQLEDLQKALAREKKDSENARKEVERELKASETRRNILESKIDQMKTRLTATKELLKECQEELNQARGALSRGNGPSLQRDVPVKNPLKRGVHEMNRDVIIGTPDRGVVRGKRPGTKRGIVDQTALGEKSMFSITPYLNRTVNMASDTPVTGGEPKIVANSPVQTNCFEQPTFSQINDPPHMSAAPLTLKPRGRKKATEKSSNAARKALADIQTSKSNRRTKVPLEKVDEEETDENATHESGSFPLTVTTEDQIDLVKSVSEPEIKLAKMDLEPKKKKRKLLGAGKTLFDEEDGEVAKRPAKIALGPARLLGKGPVGAGLKVTGGVGFGIFSPLKKDRRGVGSSFLS